MPCSGPTPTDPHTIASLAKRLAMQPGKKAGNALPADCQAGNELAMQCRLVANLVADLAMYQCGAPPCLLHACTT